ncbi:stage II sporulation protein P [Virgibacillus ndiopensis]|uniref:stage II sporulation protein P n=1 Tax=Virgibacillus ndiopensis TaxID=2004408 RepID=UPI000C07EF82|nr:stage II sporulation protein P [Virgibacillus ndiopensis]
MIHKNDYKSPNRIVNRLYKKSGIYLVCIIILFIVIGVLTTISPAYRFSSHTITEWTSEIDGSTFLHLLGMENRAFQEAFPENERLPKLSTTLFHLATNIKPNDPKSLLGNELPGFALFGAKIIVAGEGTDYTNLPVESSPPLEEVLKDRKAVVDEPEEESKKTDNKDENPSTGKRDVVFIYNTHNTESFLPLLPGVNDPNLAHHKTANITKVSDRLAKSIEANGIGTTVDHTNIMNILNSKDWDYGKAYTASRPVVKEAITSNKDIQYVFDIHRDAIGKEETTKTINGKDYARIAIVIGQDYANTENLKLANKIHKLMKKKYPGLSRGIFTQGGRGHNGVYNQDLSNNALTFEIGGVYNNLEELYRSADALAEVFSDFYWDAEKVNADSKEE